MGYYLFIVYSSLTAYDHLLATEPLKGKLHAMGYYYLFIVYSSLTADDHLLATEAFASTVFHNLQFQIHDLRIENE